MGTFFVTIGVGDPSGSRFEPVEMLVDTGSTYTMLPASVLRSIGVAPVETLRFRLADGRRVRTGSWRYVQSKSIIVSGHALSSSRMRRRTHGWEP